MSSRLFVLLPLAAVSTASTCDGNVGESDTRARETVRVSQRFDGGEGSEDAIKGGAMANKVMTAQEVASLATMPSREQLLAQLMATMRAPVAKFVQTLNEVPGKFVRTLAALHSEREKQSA